MAGKYINGLSISMASRNKLNLILNNLILYYAFVVDYKRRFVDGGL